MVAKGASRDAKHSCPFNNAVVIMVFTGFQVALTKSPIAWKPPLVRRSANCATGTCH